MRASSDLGERLRPAAGPDEHLRDKTLPSLGAELEMAVIGQAGRSACVTDAYFEALHRLKGGASAAVQERQGGRAIAVKSQGGVNGIDNGFNLLESALAPVTTGGARLSTLAAAMKRDLACVQEALAEEGLALTSLAQHPTAGVGPEWYARTVAPKSVYSYLTGCRGWDHAVGIDAKAQNGPTTGVDQQGCIAALNLLLAAAPAFIALFANSPFESGRPTGLKETRMTLWPRMVARSRVPADRDLVGLPPDYFASLGDYFRWTFSPATVMHAIPALSDSYKGGADLFIVGDGRTNAADFFAGGPVSARAVSGPDRTRTVTPSAAHFEFLQWSNFLDTRIRFALGQPAPDTMRIAEAFREPVLFDDLFRDHVANLYLENRCTGATFADRDLAEQADGPVLASCMIAPSAIQAGLVAASATRGAEFLARWPLTKVRGLREAAIRDALGGDTGQAMRRFCDEVLTLASDHLPAAEQSTLAYPEWVLRSGRTAADRALRQAEHPGCAGDLDRLALLRRVLPARDLP